MKVGLFVPCYIDQFYPQAARATLELLEHLELSVVCPEGQTCCGQPLANAGYERQTREAVHRFSKLFQGCDYIVTPSGSCAYHLRKQTDFPKQSSVRLLELCEFLSTVPGLKPIRAHFPYRTGLHTSCHWQRGLRLASSSERMEPHFSIAEKLLKQVDGLNLIPLDRPDECCGFGGTFAVSEQAVSTSMGNDRLDDHQKNAAQVITGTDVSCLMHLEGLIRRQKRNLKVMHISEILNSREPHGTPAAS